MVSVCIRSLGLHRKFPRVPMGRTKGLIIPALDKIKYRIYSCISQKILDQIRQKKIFDSTYTQDIEKKVLNKTECYATPIWGWSKG